MTIKRWVRQLAPLPRALHFPSVAVFAVIFIATLVGAHTARIALANEMHTAAYARTDVAEQYLRERLVSYEQILRGGVGLFSGSDTVTQEDWSNYLTAFNIATAATGVQSIGFAQITPANGSPLPMSINSDQLVQSGAGQVDGTYANILYDKVIGSSGTPTTGIDLYSDPIRRKSMLLARDSGNITITPRVNLTYSRTQAPHTGFVMFAPYYGHGKTLKTVTDRRAALEGYVFASFRASTFFASTLRGMDNASSGFYIDSVSKQPQTVLYTSPSYAQLAAKHNTIKVERPLYLYGQSWIVHFALSPSTLVTTVQLWRPFSILLVGFFSALLIAFVVYLLVRARSHDLLAQKERAVELAKDELLSLASHQLRTPATGVKQYVGMILQGFAGDVPEEQRTLLEKANASNDRQLRIINEILHLAKIDSGRIVLAKQQVNLNELTSDIVSEQKPDITNAEHTIQLKLPQKPITILADVHMLRMAIENILSNAIKYTRKGGSIKVRLREDRTNAYISITDNGIGISQEDLGKIFRQFSRLPNEMSQQVGGTGIGLYLAKHLVELHHGHITVISTQGEGSTFTIVMPLRGGSAIKNFTVQQQT